MAEITIELNQKTITSMQLAHEEFPLVVDRPIEKGGGGEGLMGGQYLLMGIGGCFCSTLFAAANSRDIIIEGLKVKVIASISETLPKRFTDVQLGVTCTKCSDEEKFEKLLRIAEKGCLSINTIKNGINFKVLS